MKKDLIFSLILGFLCFFVISMNEKPVDRKPVINKTAIKGSKPHCSCNANVTNFTIVRDSGGWITFSWDFTGDPVGFNYGGYYNGPGGGLIPPGTVYGTAFSVRDNGSWGGRFGVLAVCSDGTTGGQTHGVLWANGVAEEYF
jgi:hypothetical protein